MIIRTLLLWLLAVAVAEAPRVPIIEQGEPYTECVAQPVQMLEVPPVTIQLTLPNGGSVSVPSLTITPPPVAYQPPCVEQTITPPPVTRYEWHAASCSRADVEAAITMAFEHGDQKVIIPPGECEWTQKLTVAATTQNISIEGAGIDQTIIRDNVDKTGSNDEPLLALSGADPFWFAISNLTIVGVSPDPTNTNKCHIALSGTSKAFRVHCVKLTSMKTCGIRMWGDLAGVIDHNEFVGSNEQGIIVSHRDYDGIPFGDGSWVAPLDPGGPRHVFIEDNVFRETHTTYTMGAMDAMEGARVVFRRNRVIGKGIGSHGTESSQRYRSVRWVEVYENTFERPADTYSASYDVAIRARGGSWVVWGNNVSGRYQRMFTASNYRVDTSYAIWGKCDGTGPYDQNTPEMRGYRCIDQVGA